MLQINHLTKSFSSVPVLKGIDLTVEKGQTVAIIGRSGSGKSTLIRCLNHLEIADGGDILMDGQVMLQNGVYAPPRNIRALCRKMGFVFQSFNLFPHMNVLQNLTEAQKCVLHRSKSDAEATARRYLEKVGLSDRERYYPYQLSGGQQQRVAIARALSMEPELLSFDEPTSALDPQLTQEVLKVLRALHEDKRTMLIVTHEMGFAREVADRVVYMANGCVQAYGTPEEVFNTEQVMRFAKPEKA